MNDSKKGLQSEIDGNHFSNTNRINDIAEKLAKMFKDANKGGVISESIFNPLKNEPNNCHLTFQPVRKLN